MPRSSYHRIRTNPRFEQLIARRSRFAWLLAAIVLVVYYGFMAVVAFQPDLLRAPLGEGMVTTLGVPVGVAIIVGSWLLAGVYVRRANKEFDAINEEILRESHYE